MFTDYSYSFWNKRLAFSLTIFHLLTFSLLTFTILYFAKKTSPFYMCRPSLVKSPVFLTFSWRVEFFVVVIPPNIPTNEEWILENTVKVNTLHTSHPLANNCQAKFCSGNIIIRHFAKLSLNSTQLNFNFNFEAEIALFSNNTASHPPNHPPGK